MTMISQLLETPEKQGDDRRNRRPVLLRLLGQGLVSRLIVRHRYSNRTHNLVARCISASDGDRVDAIIALT